MPQAPPLAALWTGARGPQLRGALDLLGLPLLAGVLAALLVPPSVAPRAPLFLVASVASFLAGLPFSSWVDVQPRPLRVAAKLVPPVAVLLTMLGSAHGWVTPWQALGGTRFVPPAPGAQDANYFDHLAAQVVDGAHGLDPLFVTWQSFGVVAFSATVYGVFGPHTVAVAAANAALNVVSGRLLVRAASPRQGLATGALLATPLFPLLFYYSWFPSKEPLTMLGLSLVVYGCSRADEKGRLALQAGGIALLSFARPNVAVLASLVAMAFVRGGLRRRILVLLALLAVVGLGFVLTSAPGRTIGQSFDIFNRLGLQDQWLESADYPAGSFKRLVAEWLIPRDLVSLVALSPLRTLVWFVAPYPLVLDPLLGLAQGPAEALHVLVAIPPAMAAVSLLVLVGLWPQALQGIREGWRSRSRALQAGVLLLALLTFVIANVQFVMGRRMHAVLEPLFVFAATFSTGWPRWGFAALAVAAAAALLVGVR